jgi:hypothetical protein
MYQEERETNNYRFSTNKKYSLISFACYSMEKAAVLSDYQLGIMCI